MELESRVKSMEPSLGGDVFLHGCAFKLSDNDTQTEELRK
jgi:hypothetical protein